MRRFLYPLRYRNLAASTRPRNFTEATLKPHSLRLVAHNRESHQRLNPYQILRGRVCRSHLGGMTPTPPHAHSACHRHWQPSDQECLRTLHQLRSPPSFAKPPRTHATWSAGLLRERARASTGSTICVNFSLAISIKALRKGTENVGPGVLGAVYRLKSM